ncbi:RNI-like protein [Pleurotus eryngii]|uniref:RNI-like protein n=1 Tax=Pleurotus eryngii TaxID=5323 RepID=A0A9P5ZQ62_PLEER|nr:RNI-like protein [Pleurotus eryngii]
MSSSSASCSPSSSAVTIPIPGKSILKRPPPPQQSLFSRITRFLPTQPSPASGDEEKPLKRAHFILPQISTVYPISSLNPPSTPTLKEEKRAIEEREAERRRRVVRGNSENTDDWWSLEKVESFYRECCAGCDEQPDPGISLAFKHGTQGIPRTVDFSGVQLNLVSASILSDVFTIEWGLRKLVFRECDLDEHILKPMLHALLIPGTLSYLSVASNRRLKTSAFRLIGAFAIQAKSLEFLDLSQNNLDKKSVEYIVAALSAPPTTGIASLRLDDCNLRNAALETLCRAIRTSSLKNISLRHNKINQTGAVALALMIRDYPDVIPAGTPIAIPFSPSNLSTPASSLPPSPASSTSPLPPLHPLPHDGTPLTSPTSPTPPARAGPILPPPRHPPTGPQTTYTPYIPKSRRGRPPPNPSSIIGQPVPIITSSSQGGVTMIRHPSSLPGHTSLGSASNLEAGGDKNHHGGPSQALLDKVRALDALPRLGALRTLDLKGNDLRTGVSYLAQVLKRNRTLKVLNLSENKLDVPCLVYIAEALKYNSCLETLDLSKNPCCGPGLEGIQSLRTAFTLNSALKRLFLSSTSMTSAGAIALAEFLPESTSLLHLDLTENNLDIASVMALRSGLRANHTLRCLDLNVPPSDEEFARMCRDILNSCIRNTEEAEKSTQSGLTNGSLGKSTGKGVWSMIEESELARSIRLGEGSKTDGDVLPRARTMIAQLRASISPDPLTLPPPVSLHDLISQAKSIASELTTLIEGTGDPSRMEELFALNDELTELMARVPSPGKPSLRLVGLSPKLSPGDMAKWTGHSNGTVITNGSLHGSPIAEEDEPDEEEEVSTPRIDKGKAKADPVPEEPEKVLSPSLSLSMTEGDTDEEDISQFLAKGDDDPALITSPTIDRSRFLVEEEGEVFRKGTVLLGPEEMEGDYAGEDLRKELLEAMVERPPPRPLLDEYGLEMNVHTPQPEAEALPVSPSPISPSQERPSPRPYISRRSSASSIMSLISPTLPPGKPDLESVANSNGMGSPTIRSPTILSPNLPSLASPRPYAPRRGSAASLDPNPS